MAIAGCPHARETGTKVGEGVELDTASGPEQFRVVGISPNQQSNGLVSVMPLGVLWSVGARQVRQVGDDEVERARHGPEQVAMVHADSPTGGRS